MKSKTLPSILCVVLLSSLVTRYAAADWPSWRGPDQNGSSTETGLISEWSTDGDGLIWRGDVMARSTPIALNGRIYVQARVGKDVTEQEQVACFDAKTGERLWDKRFNVFHTTIPFNRVGWASPAGDPETGNIYAHGVGGMFVCYSKDGDVLWEKSLTEQYGRISGYGGRTHTPVVDGDLVIISYLNSSWGAQAPGRHRYFAFDKNTGDVVWMSTPGGPPKDTTYSVPAIAVINGQRLLIAGNADGSIYALKVNTGEKVWRFGLSKRGINSSIVVVGDRAYAMHSEENLDTNAMGRVVCIDATGSGDVTETHEVWRADGLAAGYTSPAYADGRLYVIDNSSNVHALDADTGAEAWTYEIATVGKGSPTVADGKLYLPEVNGNLHIVQVGADEATVLDTEQITVDGDRFAEIFGSPIVAYGRVYIPTEGGLFCIGDPDAEFPEIAEATPAEDTPDAGGSDNAITHVQIVPGEIHIHAGETAQFKARGFDADGEFVREDAATWSLQGIDGEAEGDGSVMVSADAVPHAGTVTGELSGISGAARVRVVPTLPYEENFDGIEIAEERAAVPNFWIGAAGKYFVEDMDGNHVLHKGRATRGLDRAQAYVGPSTMSGYTIQADMMGTTRRRNMPDMGLISGRYILDLMGNHQKLEARSWTSDLRMAQDVPFEWVADVWYTMKMRVDIVGENAVVNGKVWKRGDPEPEEWTITVEDPVPNPTGSPGIYGVSYTDIYYDNLKIEVSE
ncbi:PQQ-binding-like beta-propeller repeat protein [Candidatus Poribacteria bacterium]|jgi:outer membrane protein assembly factor BamB|nr:PQQ-binding-like beta-propeller repeat protein [Candidatus Poribacteria bacterium]MBT7808468.1 PQQ-binding-like beta-propeller repeat protein [Candidatus Poribacteria bacterium]